MYGNPEALGSKKTEHDLIIMVHQMFLVQKWFISITKSHQYKVNCPVTSLFVLVYICMFKWQLL